MRNRTLTLAAALALAPVIRAQATEDWRLPFRSPNVNLEPPLEMYQQLRVMQRIAASAPEDAVFFDENGIEICRDPRWQKAYERLTSMRQDAGYLSSVIRESGSTEDRATALYGAFYDPDPQMVIRLIEHIPGEPVRALREDAYRRAVAFLRVHLGEKNEGDLEAWQKIRVGPAGQKPPRPGDATYELELMPFVKLLEVDDYRDQVQASWFLGECLKARPELRTNLLELAQAPIEAILRGENREAFEAARELVAIADPAHREPPPLDAPRARYARWLDDVLYDVFPPIRRISEGLTELYPSEDLDRVVAVGQRLLREGSFGDTKSGKLKKGRGYYRGLLIQRTPEPIDKLGLELGWVVTAINGQPVATNGAVLDLLEQSAKRVRSYLIEFVADGELRAIEFRVRK